MPLLLHRISLPVRSGLCAHSTHPRAGCQTRAKKQSLTQSVRPRKVGSAPGGLTACYRLTAHKNPLLVRAHGSELLGHFVVPAPLIMQPSEEAKQAIPNHEFYSPFVFWNNFYQFQRNVTINRRILSIISRVFVTDSFFMHFLMHLSGNRHLRPPPPKGSKCTNARRIPGGRFICALVYFA